METSPSSNSKNVSKRGRWDDATGSTGDNNSRKRPKNPIGETSSKVSPKASGSQDHRTTLSSPRPGKDISPPQQSKEGKVGSKTRCVSSKESKKDDVKKQSPGSSQSHFSTTPEPKSRDESHQKQNPDQDRAYLQTTDKIAGLEKKLEEIEKEKERCLAEMKLMREEVQRYEAIQHQKELITLFRRNLKSKEIILFIELAVALGKQENSIDGIDASTFTNLLSQIIKNQDQP